MKPVEVVWVDIEELSGGWHDQDEVDKFISEVKNRTVTHIGYLYEEDDDYIVLADSFAGCTGQRPCLASSLALRLFGASWALSVSCAFRVSFKLRPRYGYRVRIWGGRLRRF